MHNDDGSVSILGATHTLSLFNYIDIIVVISIAYCIMQSTILLFAVQDSSWHTVAAMSSITELPITYIYASVCCWEKQKNSYIQSTAVFITFYCGYQLHYHFEP